MGYNDGKILLATDGSIPALAAAIRAVGMAKRYNADLVVLNVAEHTPGIVIEKMAEDAALQKVPGVDGIKYAIGLAVSSGVRIETLTREGPVARVIVNVAAEIKAGLIIIGTSGISGMNRFMLGDVAEIVVRDAPCAVLVVKPSEEEVKNVMSGLEKQPAPSNGFAMNGVSGTLKFKIGLALFGIYIVAYALFTLAGTLWKGMLDASMLVISGMALIVGAIVIAVVYNWLAERLDRTSKEA